MKNFEVSLRIRNSLRDISKRMLYATLALVLSIVSLLGNILGSTQAHAAIGSVTEYTLPASVSNLDNINVDINGNIWFVATGTVNTGYSSMVGKLTPAGVLTNYGNVSGGGGYAKDIAMGSDGNLWFSDEKQTGGSGYSYTDYRTIKMTPSGARLDMYSSNSISKMTLGPDGNVWYITGSSPYAIGSIPSSGSGPGNYFTIPPASYSCSQSLPEIHGITAGPDGNVWFTIFCTGSNKNAIGKVTTSGAFTIYPIPPTTNIRPWDITTGSDGKLWFTEPGVNKVGTITTSGVITQYSLPTANLNPYSITAGSDGALWFVQSNGKIGRITTSGVATEYSVPGTGSIGKIVTGQDGAVWFKHGNQIARMATELINQTISFNSAAPTNITVDSPNYIPAASSTSGLPVTIVVDSSSSSVCSMDSFGKVSFQNVGVCTLNANQVGNIDYRPALQVQQSFTVAPVNADTSVALSCPTTATVGSTVTCTITVSNDGPAAAENSNLSALFPSLLSDASLSGGGVLSGQSITWSTLSFAAGDSKTFTFSATASGAGKVRISAALLQTSPDPNISNNIVDATILIS